jgi:hypothetical protein
MKIYIVVDDEEELEDMKVFSNKTEAEDYMVDYIFKCYDTEVIPSREDVRTYIRDYGFFEAIYLIEKEII